MLWWKQDSVYLLCGISAQDTGQRAKVCNSIEVKKEDRFSFGSCDPPRAACVFEVIAANMSIDF